jgi:chromosome segregation ATPase
VKLSQTVNKLKSMATKSHSLRLASLAVTVQQKAASGRDAFAEIMGEIEKMISNLRREEQDDLDHRDFCEQSQNALGGENDSLNHSKENAEAKKERLKAKSEALAGEIKSNEEAKDAQEKELEDALNTRNEEHEEYIQALKDDKAAIALLAKAIDQMSAFYSNNKIALVQEPTYSEDPDAQPETWSNGGSYGGRKSESTGVFAILEMIKEDIEKEVGEAKKSEAEATKEYEEMRAAGRDTVTTLTDLINSLSKEKAAVDQKTANTEGDIADLEGQISGNEGEAAAMKENCNWILTSFESRKTKRINEINGLQTAKSFLLGTDNSAQDDSAKYGNGM